MEDSEMMYCKDALKEQLLKAKESLKGLDSNLKKFNARPSLDPSRNSSFNKNTPQLPYDRWNSGNRDEPAFRENFRRRPANDVGDIENVPIKRRLGPRVLHSSVNGPPPQEFEDELTRKPTLSSFVVAKAHVLPPRKEAIAVKTYTKTRARDRRMFGALMGTLQKFRQEESQMKDKEDKKAQVEKKLEDAARKEKEKLRKERQQLVDARKRKEAYIRDVENNMKLVKEQEQWEDLHRPLHNYIQTITKPALYYLPKVHNEKTSELLLQCQNNLKKYVEEKRKCVKEEVDALLSKWNSEDFNGSLELLGTQDRLVNTDNLDHGNGVNYECDIEMPLHEDNDNTKEHIESKNSLPVSIKRNYINADAKEQSVENKEILVKEEKQYDTTQDEYFEVEATTDVKHDMEDGEIEEEIVKDEPTIKSDETDIDDNEMDA